MLLERRGAARLPRCPPFVAEVQPELLAAAAGTAHPVFTSSSKNGPRHFTIPIKGLFVISNQVSNLMKLNKCFLCLIDG